MSFNQNTSNLVIINYRPGAGGKFLSGCLSLSDKVLHLQEKYAETKYKKKWGEYQSFKASMSLLKLTYKHKIHIEFEHGETIYGFNYKDDLLSQLSKSNNFFKELTNQNEYIFFLTNHFMYFKNFLHFKNAKNIIIVNDEEILKIRKKEKNRDVNIEKISKKNFKDYFLFDISALKSDKLFYKEIKRLCCWLKIEIKNINFLSQLRNQFIKNLQIELSFPDEKSWDTKGYYRAYFPKKNKLI
jgi:hypothetical protein